MKGQVVGKGTTIEKYFPAARKTTTHALWQMVICHLVSSSARQKIGDCVGRENWCPLQRQLLQFIHPVVTMQEKGAGVAKSLIFQGQSEI